MAFNIILFWIDCSTSYFYPTTWGTQYPFMLSFMVISLSICVFEYRYKGSFYFLYFMCVITPIITFVSISPYAEILKLDDSFLIIIFFIEAANLVLVIISFIIFLPQFWSVDVRHIIIECKEFPLLIKLKLFLFTVLVAIPNKVLVNNNMKKLRFICWTIILLIFSSFTIYAAFLYIALQFIIIESYFIGLFFHTDWFSRYIVKFFKKDFVDYYIVYFYGNASKAAAEKFGLGIKLFFFGGGYHLTKHQERMLAEAKAQNRVNDAYTRAELKGDDRIKKVFEVEIQMRNDMPLHSFENSAKQELADIKKAILKHYAESS